MRVVIDYSSIAKRALLAGTDKDNGTWEYDQITGKEKLVNSAEFGMRNLINSFNTQSKAWGFNPCDCIIVLDGENGAAMRRSLYKLYKSKRPSTPGFVREYDKMTKEFLGYMLNLGAQVVEQPGMEADDVVGWFAHNIREDRLLVWSNDNDMLVLKRYPNVDVLCGNELNPKPYGDFPYEFIDVYKAIVGDSSDNIPGAKGFGPAAFENLYKAFGDNGLKVLRHLIQTRSLAKLKEDVNKLPSLQKLIDYAPDVEVSLKLATLQVFQANMDKMHWQHGLNTGEEVHPMLMHFAQKRTAVTADNFDEVFTEIKNLPMWRSHIALDIETSTPIESDDWMFELKGKEDSGLDIYGSELTGVGITMGDNFQNTYYFAVDHKGCNNCSKEQIQRLLKHLNRYTIIIQNSSFELTVLKQEFGWFFKDIEDTKLMANYVDENSSAGLKQNSERWLGYKQVSYEETTGGRKMNELTVDEVLSYGTDDTVCTAALFQWYQLHMFIEQVFHVYRKVEISAAYWTAQAFLDGVKINQVTLSQMIARDAKAKAEEEKVLNDYLIQQGWQGAVFVEATADTWNTSNWIKYAFFLMYGTQLDTRVKKIERLIEAVREQGGDELADALQIGDIESLNKLVSGYFKSEPDFNTGSPKQMQNLMYEVMGLPIRIRNKPTQLMRLKGEQGSPSTDDVAIGSALHYDLTEPDDVRRKVLNSLLKIKLYNTREGLFYKTYPKLPHWKDNLIHCSINQTNTVTRRFTCSNPNLQQLPKGQGDFRRIFVPHHKDAMIVSLDFAAQELRLIADYSKDENMLSCFIGENKKDMHSLTGSQIANLEYPVYREMVANEDHEKHKWAKDIRKTAKIVNFSTEYGAQAAKLSQTLMVTEQEAQDYIDAKSRAFHRSEEWKKEVIAEAHQLGYSTTMLGGRRHLPDLRSINKWDVAKAERQSVNFKIQGSGAEMTKLAMGRIWDAGLREKFDIRFIAPIHDELVFSIAVKDIPQVVPLIHQYMTAQYANMEVPVESSVSLGVNFGDQFELGESVIPDAENLKELIQHVYDKAQQA